MKNKEITQLSESELNSNLEELKKEMMKINVQRSSGTAIKNPGMVRKIKRNIARIKTALHSRGGKGKK